MACMEARIYEITLGSRANATGCRIWSLYWTVITGAAPGWTQLGKNGKNSLPCRPILSNSVPFFPLKSGHFARFKVERQLS